MNQADNTADILFVDVFAIGKYTGNPLAVVRPRRQLTNQQMLSIASWLNLSETVFLYPSTTTKATYLTRIFTPSYEVPFAGHPTLGTAYAALQWGLAAPGTTELTQECGVGLVSVTCQDEALFFTSPEAKVTTLTGQDATVATLLGCHGTDIEVMELLNVGIVWVVARLHSDSVVLGLEPDFPAVKEYCRTVGADGITVYGRKDAAGQGQESFEIRSFVPLAGVNEDPVCGSGNACVGNQISRTLKLPAYTAYQGQKVGRNGKIEVLTDSGHVKVGGKCSTMLSGTIDIGFAV